MSRITPCIVSPRTLVITVKNPIRPFKIGVQFCVFARIQIFGFLCKTPNFDMCLNFLPFAGIFCTARHKRVYVFQSS